MCLGNGRSLLGHGWDEWFLSGRPGLGGRPALEGTLWVKRRLQLRDGRRGGGAHWSPVRDLALRKMFRVVNCSQRQRGTLRWSVLGHRLGEDEVGSGLTQALRLGPGPGLDCGLHVRLRVCWWFGRRRTERRPRRRVTPELHVRRGGWLAVAVQRGLHGGGGAHLRPYLSVSDHRLRDETPWRC